MQNCAACGQKVNASASNRFNIDLTDLQNPSIPVIKGPATLAFPAPQQAAADSDPIDVRQYNAATIFVTGTGTSIAATVRISGSQSKYGTYYELDTPTRYNNNPAATRRSVTILAGGGSAGQVIDAPVGTPWLQVRLTDVSGTFAANQGFQVLVMPYVASGMLTMPYDHKFSRNIMPATAIVASGDILQATDYYFAGYQQLGFILNVASNSLGSATVDVWVQTSIDNGITVDDICRFSQITAAGGNTNYFALIQNTRSGGISPRTLQDRGIAAGSIVNYFADELLIWTRGTSFAAGNTVTLTLRAAAWGRG